MLIYFCRENRVVSKAVSPLVAECSRAVFASFLWHEGIVHDAMACASYLKFNAMERDFVVKQSNAGEKFLLVLSATSMVVVLVTVKRRVNVAINSSNGRMVRASAS